MADIIVLRGSYNNLVGGIPVTTISNYGDTTEEDLYGKDIASCISYLLEEGLTLQYQSADSSGYTVMLIRSDTVPQSPVVTLLQGRVGTVVTLMTDVGAVTGTLLPLGTDVAQLLEESGDTIIISFIQINGVV